MAQKTKIFAPKGYHFMMKKNGNFYLMRGEYTAHTLHNGDKSSEYIMMQYLTEHPVSGEMDSSSDTSARTVGRTVRTTTGSVTNTSGRTSSSGGTSSGGY